MNAVEIFMLTAWLTAMFWVNAYFIAYFAAKGYKRGNDERN